MLIATEWKSFRAPDFETVRSSLAEPVIFDGRNVYDPQLVAKYGIKYYSIGRPASTPLGESARLQSLDEAGNGIREAG